MNGFRENAWRTYERTNGQTWLLRSPTTSWSRDQKGWLTDVEKEIIQRNILTRDTPAEVEVAHNDVVQNEIENDFHVQEEGIPIAIDFEVMEEVHNEIDLSPEDVTMLTRLKELVISDTKPIFNLKSFNRFDLMAKTTAVNNLLKYFAPSN